LLQSKKYSKRKAICVRFSQKNLFFLVGHELEQRGALKRSKLTQKAPFFNLSAFTLRRMVVKGSDFFKFQQNLSCGIPSVF
jgi:hypothetical protein